jgi:hypothetical protein
VSVAPVTYTSLEAAVADRADIVVNTGRHTTAKMQARIYRSIKKWELLLASAGDDTHLKIYRTTTDPDATLGPDNWSPRQYIVQPEGMLFVRGIDIYRSGRPYAMVTFSEAERGDPTLLGEWWAAPNVGMPTRYRLGGRLAATDQYLIQISPWADAPYTVDVRYIPAPPNPDSAGTSFDLVLGGESFVIADAALQCLTTDGRSGTPEFQALLMSERDACRDEALADLSRRGSYRKRDTWLERRRLRMVSRWRAE